jgi:hypothetical protein
LFIAERTTKLIAAKRQYRQVAEAAEGSATYPLALAEPIANVIAATAMMRAAATSAAHLIQRVR